MNGYGLLIVYVAFFAFFLGLLWVVKTVDHRKNSPRRRK